MKNSKRLLVAFCIGLIGANLFAIIFFKNDFSLISSNGTVMALTEEVYETRLLTPECDQTFEKQTHISPYGFIIGSILTMATLIAIPARKRTAAPTY